MGLFRFQITARITCIVVCVFGVFGLPAVIFSLMFTRLSFFLPALELSMLSICVNQCRAECLLALFIHTVESPSFEKAGKENRIDSNVDFLDTERIKVLFPE